MDNIAGGKSSLTWAVQISVVLLVILWLFPTAGLLVSSFLTLIVIPVLYDLVDRKVLVADSSVGTNDLESSI